MVSEGLHNAIIIIGIAPIVALTYWIFRDAIRYLMDEDEWNETQTEMFDKEIEKDTERAKALNIKFKAAPTPTKQNFRGY